MSWLIATIFEGSEDYFKGQYRLEKNFLMKNNYFIQIIAKDPQTENSIN